MNYQKDFEGAFLFIDDIISAKTIQIDNHYLIEKAPNFKKVDRGFCVSFRTCRDVEIPKKEYPYCLGKYSFETSHNCFTVSENGSYISNVETDDVNIMLSSFWSRGMDCSKDDYHWIYLSPLQQDYKIDFRDYEYYAFTFDKTSSTQMINIPLDKGNVHVGEITYHKKKYLFLDFQYACAYDEMYKTAFPTIVALGLLSGFVCLDEAYCTAYSDKGYSNPIGMRYQSLVPSFKYHYSVFTTNMHIVMNTIIEKMFGTKHDCIVKTYIERLQHQSEEIKSFPSLVLGKLIQQFVDEEPLLRAAYMMINGSSMTLELQPSIISVVLETITSELEKTNNTAADNKISKNIWDNIRRRLDSIIEDSKQKGEINEKWSGILKSKVQNINSLTNKSKLTAPFKFLGYNLSKEENSAIDNRNFYLHGHIKTDMNKMDEAFDDLQYNTLMLHRLCAILLLKNAGFEGHIINNVKLYMPKRSKHAFLFLG
jgi:hypothetical protein